MNCGITEIAETLLSSVVSELIRLTALASLKSILMASFSCFVASCANIYFDVRVLVSNARASFILLDGQSRVIIIKKAVVIVAKMATARNVCAHAARHDVADQINAFALHPRVCV